MTMWRYLVTFFVICLLIKLSITTTTITTEQTTPWNSEDMDDTFTTATTYDAVEREETTSAGIFKNATVEFHNLGCWKERRNKAIPSVEETLTPLYGEYTSRIEAIKICASYAESQGFTVFALQNGGLCSTSGNAQKTFDYYGTSGKCLDDGKGAEFANQVYRIGPLNTEVKYSSIGCYEDAKPRAIAKVDGRHELLSDNFRERVNATEKCAIVAFSLGYKVFALQNGGRCFTATDAHLNYAKYGSSKVCKEDGEGGRWANEVYGINGWQPEVKRFAFTFESDLCSNETSCAEAAEDVLQQYCANSDDEICNSYNLIDFDECGYTNGETEHNNCSINARCINSYGSYTCECESSYIDLNPSIPGRNCSKNRTIN